MWLAPPATTSNLFAPNRALDAGRCRQQRAQPHSTPTPRRVRRRTAARRSSRTRWAGRCPSSASPRASSCCRRTRSTRSATSTCVPSGAMPAARCPPDPWPPPPPSALTPRTHTPPTHPQPRRKVSPPADPRNPRLLRHAVRPRR
jgi:hypothetical protein